MFASERPKSWKEMSVDMRLMFVFHGAMMVLMVAGGSLALQNEIFFVVLLAIILTGISIIHRSRSGWKWPGVSGRETLYAFLGVVAISVLLFAATPLVSPRTPQILPWYLAALNIGVFGVLEAVKVVCSKEADFLAQCSTTDQNAALATTPAPQPEPPMQSAEGKQEEEWKLLAQRSFSVLFIVVWLILLASFYYAGDAMKKGSPTPTVTQSETLQNHGKTVYITADDKKRVDLLHTASTIAVPMVVLVGAILHFGLGVKVFGNRKSSKLLG